MGGMEAAHDTTFFTVLLIVLGATAIVLPLVQRLRLPPVVGYMAVGMAVGTQATGAEATIGTVTPASARGTRPRGAAATGW